jgi:flagellin
MARIANNIAALNSWRQLTRNESMFSSSLEKLSSGYRINKAGDDPAGLVLSEQFRAQITGIKQAVSNTQDAASMIQTAEGNMQEMHAILNQIRGLVLHAKNTGVNDSISIDADQNQVDEAVNALNKIANNTYFGGKSLLDGSLTNRGTVLDRTNVQSVSVGSTAPTGTTLFAIDVDTAATQAQVKGTLALTDADAATRTQGGTITVNGNAITVTASNSDTELKDELNAAFLSLDLDMTATVGTGGDANKVIITHNKYGSDYTVSVNDSAKNIFTAAGFSSDAGSDIVGKVGTSASETGSGLTLIAASGNYSGTEVTVTTAANTTTGVFSNVVSVDKGGLTFQVGSSASDTVSAAIQDVRATALGTAAGGASGLNAILTGATYNLSTDPSTALSIIDEAINDVSTARAQLGAIQKYTLETKVNSLNVALENVTASESRVRDVDMASEMANFTKFQVLIQSATAMLAQANQAPTSILSLLGR